MVVPIVLIIAASFFLGTFGLGMKYNKPMSWEAFWLVHALSGMLLIPMIWALLSVPDLFQSIATAPAESILKGMFFGFVWGIGGVMFGMSVKFVGVSMTYGIVMGLTGAIGGLTPLFQMPGFAEQKDFPVIIMGTLVMMIGVALVAIAGIKREKINSASSTKIEGIKTGKEFKKGIAIVLISGVLSAFINIGFSNASPVAVNAEKFGASPVNASLAAWVVVLWGAIVFNALYSAVLLIKNGSWRNFNAPNIGKPIFWAVFAAILWFGSLGVYGIGATMMGRMGTVIGWPVFVGLSLIFSNFWAIRTGEWNGIEAPKILLFIGIAILIVATVILSLANIMN